MVSPTVQYHVIAVPCCTVFSHHVVFHFNVRCFLQIPNLLHAAETSSLSFFFPSPCVTKQFEMRQLVTIFLIVIRLCCCWLSVLVRMETSEDVRECQVGRCLAVLGAGTHTRRRHLTHLPILWSLAEGNYSCGYHGDQPRPPYLGYLPHDRPQYIMCGCTHRLANPAANVIHSRVYILKCTPNFIPPSILYTSYICERKHMFRHAAQSAGPESCICNYLYYVIPFYSVVYIYNVIYHGFEHMVLNLKQSRLL